MAGTFEDWIEGSAFVGEDGRPTMFFHGTDIHDPFNIFTRFEDHSLGFHFGSMEAANDRISQIFRMAPPDENEGLIIPVYCRARNPLRLEDQYTWEQDAVVAALAEAGVLSEEEEEFVADSASAEMIFAAVEAAGYDCIVYRNRCEAENEAHDSILVWRAELLKSPYSLSFDMNDPRLLPQNETSEFDTYEWECREEAIVNCKEDLRMFRQASSRLAVAS